MRRIFIALVLIFASVIPHAFGAEALKRIRIASKGDGETLLPYLISHQESRRRTPGKQVGSAALRICEEVIVREC